MDDVILVNHQPLASNRAPVFVGSDTESVAGISKPDLEGVEPTVVEPMVFD